MKKYFMVTFVVFMTFDVNAQSVVFKQSPIISAVQENSRELEEIAKQAHKEVMIGEISTQTQEEAARKELEAEQEAILREQEMKSRPKPVKLYDGKYKIVALVNNEIISSRDLQSAVNMFIVNTGMSYGPKTKDIIVHRVMQSLIDEKLKINEAKKNGIAITNGEINSAVNKFAQSNNIPYEKLESILKQDGVDMNSLRTKIEADAAWQKLIAKKLGGLAQVTPLEIKKEKENITKDLQKSRYMVSEIVISSKNAKDIYSLVSVLREDPRFELYAMQFSESASASRGGDLGWVNKENIDPKMAQKLDNMKEGDVSDPIRVADKYYIMKLNAKYDSKHDKSKVPSDEEVRIYLQNKKADEFINRYTQDVRNRAIIEIRE